MLRARTLCALVRTVVTGIAVTASSVSPAQTVWSGLSFTFTSPGGPLRQSDEITPDVALARGNTQGLFNAAQENNWNGSGPVDTMWATNINNPDETISAANFAGLQFDSWLEAYGGTGQIGHTIVGRDAVLHLVSDNIYLDIRFTEWGQGSTSGGSFAYMRATAPTGLVPTGDYDGNGQVDAADYVVWRDTLTQSATAGEGADGNANGTIDQADYEFWRARFGNAVPGASGAATVPEPAVLFLVLSCLPLLAGCRRTLRHG